MFRRKFIDRLRQKYQTGGELATTYGGKAAHLLEGIGHVAPKIAGTAGRFAGAASIPLMLGDFYQRGQRLSKGKVNVNQEPFLQNAIANNESIFKKQEGGMYNQMKQYQMGGQQLPGGEMEPIPGSDAVQFNGQSHDEGGIMIDDQTEVEGGETMDQVTMAKNGGKRSDYFFSDHLKEGGVSYANMHKEILAEGGDQEKIDWLAQMQERAAGRSPGKIQTAESGGTRKYQVGGYTTDTTDQVNDNMLAHRYKILEEIDDGKPVYNEINNNEFIDPNDLNDKGDAESFLNNFFKSREDQRIKEKKEIEKVITENPVINKTVPNKKVTKKKKTAPVVSNTRVPTNETMLKIDPIQPGTIGGEMDLSDNLQLARTPEQQEEIIRREGTPESNALLDELKDKARRGTIPTEAYIAGIAQLLPAAYSFFNKQPDAEQGSYTPGFTSPIIAERGKASKLERVNYNNERSNNAADMRGINRFIETSGGGPANIINKMAAYSRKQEGNAKITAAETSANTQIANQEAQMEQQMSINNMSRAQQASAQNAQMISAEAARADQINMSNAAARQKVKDDEEYMKYQGVSATASGIGGLLGDALSYKANERMARAIGSEGIYDRDRLRTVVTKYAEKNGIPGICESGACTEADINKYITSTNKTKEEPKEETKK
jgi:hypothetical protein